MSLQATTERSGAEPRLRGLSRPWAILACAIPLAILSQFYRSSNGVIAPDLMAELDLGADDIGALSGSFFIVFALLQMPIGVAIDRWGGRLVIAGMLILAVAGSVVFALAGAMPGLTAGRFLIGVGFAPLMVGALVILSRWFEPAQFSTALSLLFASSNAGSLVATLPLAAAAQAWGWRATFVGLALLTASLTALFYAVVRDAPRGHAYHGRTPESLPAVAAGLRQAWAQPGVGLILPMIAVGYASVIAVLGLWGGPYLHAVHGLDAVARGNVLSVMAVAMIAGTLVYGPLDRRLGDRRLLVTLGAGATVASLVALGAWADAPLPLVTLMLSLFAFFGSYSLLVMAHGMTLFPEALKGRGVTTLNTALMGGAALMQVATGWLIGAFDGGDATAPYRALFLVLALATLLALVLYRRIPAARP